MKLLVAASLILSTSIFAYGHSCASFDETSDARYREEIAKVDAIFYGEVVAIRDQNEIGQRIEVKVLRTWKGVDAEQIVLWYFRAYNSFEKEIGGLGTRKTFYATKSAKDGGLGVWFCSFESYDDRRTKKELGEGTEIAEKGPPMNVEAVNSNEGFFSWLWRRITSLF